MIFSEFPYERPDMTRLKADFAIALQRFQRASTLDEAETAFAEIYRLRAEFQTMYNIAYIRHSGDTRDSFYETENNFFDEQLPVFEELKTDFYRSLLNSSWRPKLEETYGKQLFAIAELSLRTFRPDVIEDLQEENRLASSYNKLKAKAQVEFEGETYNLSSIQPLEEDVDRTKRAAAATAKWDWLASQQEEMERIFDQLVKVRHRIAQKLGFDNFVELGYARMLRTDYNAENVAFYREQIRQYIVPLATQLYQQQAKRLGLERLRYYDEPMLFREGNPQPQGQPEWIVERAAEMYAELSPETDTFFRFMQERDLMDLVSRDGKSTGGYCTYVPKHRAPFIFSNFNGTSGDIDVLTHEAGHAFQVYSSRDLSIAEYNWPTYEACEIHSMSMEFFTWPWMAKFFQDAVEHYRFGHLSSAIYFLPYGVAVDEFQHFVYANPAVSLAERNQAWRDIEAKYLPQRDYAGHPFLEAGGFWQKQTHIFAMPFYYIDYTLAQICAFQFWLKDQDNHDSAWSDYVRLCKAGGSASFLDLVQLAGLESPFSPGCVQRLGVAVGNWLEKNSLNA
ncbi:MAG: M3 family oligoendopeptidase [Bacteroidota bacterium]